MDIHKKFDLLANIMRASHFEWRRAVLKMSPDTDPIELVKQYWAEVGKDTAKYYLKKIDKEKDIAGQVAQLYVSSSVAMGEDAEVVINTGSTSSAGNTSNKSTVAKHNACPWYDWHKRENLLAEDQVGCDFWLKTVVDEINKELKTKLCFSTQESLPTGGQSCRRVFWED